MQNDKIVEGILDGDCRSYANAVEKFLLQRVIQEGISVFIIGDDDKYLNPLVTQLETDHNFEVIGRSVAAMEQVMVQLNRCTPDVILFDVGHGVSHHLRTTQLIRNIAPGAELLAIMPDALPLHIQQARWCGFHGWVLKEQSLQDVIAKITTLRQRQ